MKTTGAYKSYFKRKSKLNTCLSMAHKPSRFQSYVRPLLYYNSSHY